MPNTLVETVWRSLGCPDPDHFTAVGEGQCAVCGSEAVPVADTARVVSEKFTDWERLTRCGAGVCRGCAWALRAPEARSFPRAIGGGGVQSTWTAVAAMLSRPLGPSEAAVCPVGGRKHLLPFATWGYVTCDSGLIPWREGEAGMFTSALLLRSMGLSVRALSEGGTLPLALGMPPGAALKAVEAYGRVRDWRSTPAWPVALRVIRGAGATS